ncbi:membrane protein [Xanthomonas pisi DSM 18956]|nr:membrane protein [Xanthomonas pisi DSM 18956]
MLEAISRQRYVSVIRGRPARIFDAHSDTQRFWISIGWDAALTCTLLALIVWFACAEWTSSRRTRR